MKHILNPALIRIEELCELNNWTHYRLAKESDIPLNSMNNMLKRNTYPTIPTLDKICEGFGITLKDFFDFDYSPSKSENDFSSEELQFLRRYHSLSRTEKLLLNSYLDGLQRIDFSRESEEPLEDL